MHLRVKQLVHLKKNDLETMRVVLKSRLMQVSYQRRLNLPTGQNLYVDVTAIEQQLDTDFGLKILSAF